MTELPLSIELRYQTCFEGRIRNHVPSISYLPVVTLTNIRLCDTTTIVSGVATYFQGKKGLWVRPRVDRFTDPEGLIS